MIKTLKNILHQDRDNFRVPRRVQDTVPIKRIWKDGTFLVGNKYSRTFKFTDINYSVASEQDKLDMFLLYGDLLNSLEVGATTKITVNNRFVSFRNFSFHLMELKGDDLDKYRIEFNRLLTEAATKGSGILQEKYVTISVVKRNIEEANIFFNRVAAEISSRFAALSSRMTELNASERLRIFHDFFRAGEEEHYRFDFDQSARKGHSFVDAIVPASMSIERDHIRIGDKYARVLFLKEFPSFLKDSMVTEICEMQRNMMFSIDIIPVPTEEAVKEVERKLLGTESDITKWQQQQNKNNNFSAVVPYSLEQQRKESTEYLNDLTNRDQRMMFVTVTAVHMADTLEELDADTEAFLSIGRKHLCDFEKLTYQQLQGLITVLPYGLRKINALRTLTTESTAVLMPFSAQEISYEDGFYCGQNAISRNQIFVNREKLLNGNGFYLGTSGSGKSFFAKKELAWIILMGLADVIVMDPESEYGHLIKALGGEVIRIAADSKTHINAMDMDANYSDSDNPLKLKADFMFSLCEQLMGAGHIGTKEKTIIDRCTTITYREYLKNNFTGTPPTLKDFHKVLLAQPEPEAKELALAVELFADGSLNTFAYQTNVATDNPYICYDIHDLGKHLRSVGMLVVLDSIYNRILRNRKQGRMTFVFIDEIYLLFSSEYSSNFLLEQWKRARKCGACYTGISQNVEELLKSDNARMMLANSEFITLLNQAPTDRQELSELLGISDTQLSYVSNAEAGKGLLLCAGSIVPFEDKFPKDTELYKLMTTKPREMLTA